MTKMKESARVLDSRLRTLGADVAGVSQRLQ